MHVALFVVFHREQAPAVPEHDEALKLHPDAVQVDWFEAYAEHVTEPEHELNVLPDVHPAVVQAEGVE